VNLKQKLKMKLKTETELKKIDCNKRGENLWHQEQELKLKKILARPKLMKCRNGIIKLLIVLRVRPSVFGSVLTRLVCS